MAIALISLCAFVGATLLIGILFLWQVDADLPIVIQVLVQSVICVAGFSIVCYLEQNMPSFSFYPRLDAVNAGRMFWLLVSAAVLGPVFALPAAIAKVKNKKNRVAIAALNFVAGFTFVGWVVALVWSLTEDK